MRTQRGEDAKGEVHHAGGLPPLLFPEFQIKIPLLPSLAPINDIGSWVELE
jgi:hypothetical protein